MSRKITDDEKLKLLLLNMSVAKMQGHVFYCEDGDGVLRRWTPPKPVTLSEVKDD